MISEIELHSIEQYQSHRAQILPNYPNIGFPDSAIYLYCKEATFLRKKQERLKLYFFQGLNTFPQNLSVFLMDEVKHEKPLHAKQNLVRGIFNVYNIYTKTDCIIEVSIPGTLKIYKPQNVQPNQKGKSCNITTNYEAIKNEEVELMYLSSVLRSMLEKNLLWGRYYELFKDSGAKALIDEFQAFLKVFLRHTVKRDIYISEAFEATAEIKGSHSLSLVLRFASEKKITSQVIKLVEKQMADSNLVRESPKINIFLAELYSEAGKFSKSVECMIQVSKKFSKDPYLLYYKAKYLYSLLLVDDALTILNSIVQFNQFEIWMLLAKIHIGNKSYSEGLICLSHAARLSKYKHPKSIEGFWASLQDLGKPKYVTGSDPIEYHPKLHVRSENPLNIPVKNVEEKMRCIIEHNSWRFNHREKEIYSCLQRIIFKMEQKKFESIIHETFFEPNIECNQVLFKKGMSESMFMTDLKFTEGKDEAQSQSNVLERLQKEEMPLFLKEESEVEENKMSLGDQNRNLSIIPEIESVIENSNYEEQPPEQPSSTSRRKREMSDSLYKIMKVILTEDGEYEKAIFESNYAKVLPIYNKLRVSTKNNNYYCQLMFGIFAETGNYSSMVVLIAETLDFIESKGMKKMRKLPYWMQAYIFLIINEKGIKFLNNIFNKLNFIDEAVLDTIELARSWKIAGLNY